MNMWYRDDRPVSNVEMMESVQAAKQRRTRRYMDTGYCCDEGPYADGTCRHGLGRCYLLTEAWEIVKHERA